MLTKLTVRNFKKFKKVEVELGSPVVFIGPNNSGKTTALQALALWDVGLKRWNEKRKGKKTPEKRPGVTINRRDLVSIPMPYANLLWYNLHVRDVQKVKGKQQTKNIRIEIIVEGVTEDKAWECGLEFDYANEESIYCRPLRYSDEKGIDRMPVPNEAEKVQLAFLYPMSGLSPNETRLDPGAIYVRIGEGRTSEVLRNICYKISEDKNNSNAWDKLVEHIKSLFGSELEKPKYIPERGEIFMSYRERGVTFDISSSGRGLQQTLLVLAYMYAHPGAVLLIDEPDAHLEILRQRENYQLLNDVARKNGNQIIVASHSEVMLEEAAGRDVVVAFVGEPHRIDDRGSQVRKSLKEIGFEDYYLAEQTGWVLYLEGSTDLAILKEFAKVMENQNAQQVLERPFVHYVGNQPNKVQEHFFGLREAFPRLVGIAIFDKLDKVIPENLGAEALMWERQEIENYLCYRETLEAYARAEPEQESPGPLFTAAKSDLRIKVMRESIKETEIAFEKLYKGSPWDHNTKVSDEFLPSIFKTYFKKLGITNIMAKKNYYELARFVPKEKIDPGVKSKLEAIVKTALKARPVREE